ncbi:MAG: hypothetical protein NTZ16_05240 [Verrucomicrobia bacterium]|nr:hypothetical protein [Verrucomicrobiota bacterium]
MDEEATEPTRSDWIALVVIVFPMFTGIGAVIPLICIGYFYLGSPAAVAFWFVRRELNRKYWLLTSTELIFGRWNAKSLPLSSIKKVIVGMPPLLGGVEKLASPGVRGFASDANTKALLIIFEDGRLLPLKLSFLDNGPFLTAELVKRLPERVKWNHQYTQQEIKLLRRIADPNSLSAKQSLQGLF